MLITVFIINFANASHYIAFASVTKTAAKYYDQTGDRIDLIIIAHAFQFPWFILSAYVVETWGLKVSLRLAGLLTAIGKLHVYVTYYI